MKSQTQNYLFLFIALCLLLGVGFFVYTLTQEEAVPSVSQLKYRNASLDNIVVSKPLPGEKVAQTFSLQGEARGGWYFEASFPVEVQGIDGEVLTTAIAQAEGEWMTELFVTFKAQVEIPASYHGPATVILKKDNPSGMPENDGSLSYPIVIE
jgi:hypothetical protein